MAEEKIFLDETFPIVKYNNAAPVAGLHLLKRRDNAQVANVRVIVTDKRIVVDEKMTVLANVAAVSVGDDEKEVAEHNAAREALVAAAAALPEKAAERAGNRRLGFFLLGGMALAVAAGVVMRTDGAYCGGMCVGFVLTLAGIHLIKQNAEPADIQIPPEFTPDYAVVIESAGTRDNALVSKDRMVVQRIVRAISDALVAR